MKTTLLVLTSAVVLLGMLLALGMTTPAFAAAPAEAGPCTIQQAMDLFVDPATQITYECRCIRVTDSSSDMEDLWCDWYKVPPPRKEETRKLTRHKHPRLIPVLYITIPKVA